MKTLLFVIMIVAGASAAAQQSGFSAHPYLPKAKTTAYGALSAHYSKFNGQGALFTGLYAGVMLKHKLMIGAGGYMLTTRHKGYGLNAASHQQNNWHMGYGGLMLEYTLMGNKDIHFSANTLVGGGIIKNGRGRGTIPENGSDELKDIDASGFFVVQPGVNVEVVAATWMRIAAGVGYRYVSGVEQNGITNKDMSAPTASLSFKFGLF